MTDPLVVTAATVLLLVLSAFFVVIEFALLGARRHRLEEEARTSRSARAALRGVSELTIMLAVAQLGITACTFALGAVTKPAVDAWLGPTFSAWGLPAQQADIAAFLLSLFAVTFLHLVVGEMAPKSWAIAHPELAAKVIGLPSRALAWALRPLLLWVNGIANRLVAASGYEPADRQATGGQDIETLRQLVEHSAASGTLGPDYRARLARVLDLERLRVEDLLPHAQVRPTSVPAGATVGDVRAASAVSGHMRVLVERGAGSLADARIVHVRDALLEPADRPVTAMLRDPLTLDAATPVYEALARMRETGAQLAVVLREGRFVGVVTVSDVLQRVLPRSAGGR